MKIFNLVFFSLFLAIISHAQESDTGDLDHNWCGKNHFTEKHFEQYPEARYQSYLDSIVLSDAARNFQLQKDGPYIIPVVFHVVHVNGEENISNDQINSAIEELNKDFNAENIDLSNTVAAFSDIVADVGVEFRLARKDPDGNCTNGINRVYNPLSVNATEGIKSGESASWGQSSYLNIWVVNSIEGGTAAYALLPSVAAFFPSDDGIVIEHNHVGSIGTSQLYHRHTLSHEVGHYLNLEHTWGSSNTPGITSNCGMDDGVGDTPNTLGRQSYGQNCDLDDETCGSLDNVQNIMDYGWCYTMFSEGQKTRMLAALESSVANRNDLWSDQNLQDTGVLEDDVVCVADFTTEEDPVICPGSQVEFIDLSYNGVSEYAWVFEGGTPSTSSSANPAVVYNNPGTYEVTLTASNENGSASVTKSEFITVLSSDENVIPFTEDFESFTSLESNDENWFIENDDGTDVKWKVTSEASVSGSKSVFVNGRDNPFSFESTEVLISPSYDLSGVTSDNAVLTFKYAHAQRTTSADDRLRIFISKDCGDTWSLRETLDIDELPTVDGIQSGFFVPSSDDDWSEVVIDNVSSVFQTETFRFRLDYRSFRGNNIYIDDVNIFDPATVGLESVDFINRVSLYPNPTTGSANLDYSLKNTANLTIEIVDLSGRVVREVFSGNQPAGNQIISIDASTLQNGVYLIRLQSQGQQIVRKFVKH